MVSPIMNNRSVPVNPAALAALLTVTIWGTNFVFQKGLLTELEPWPFLFARFSGMLAIAWVMVWAARRRAQGAERHRYALARGDVPKVAVSGALGYTLYITSSTIGLSYTSAFSGALLIAVSPVFVALLLAALRLERIGRMRWLGLAVSVAGVGLFLSDKVAAGWGAASWGDAISLLSAFFYAAYNVANKPLLSRYPATLITAATMSFGAVPVIALAAPAALATDWAALSPGAWSGLAWSIVFPVYVAWTLWSWAGARLGVSATAGFMYLVPVISGVCAAALLGEPFSALKMAGAAVTLLGLALGQAKRLPALSPRMAAWRRGRLTPSPRPTRSQ